MKIEYTALGGGLDLISGAVSVRPGRASQGLNFEQVFGKQGYRRLDGYERFSGQPQPHKASYYIQGFKQGSSPIVAGDVVTGVLTTAYVVGVELDSGAWATSNAKGRLLLDIEEGDGWVDGIAILKGGAVVATALENSFIGRAANSKAHLASLKTVTNRKRAAIGKPPGSGPILGVAVYRDWVVAARNSTDGATASIFKSTSAGWDRIRAGLLPGGRFDFAVANFSGDSQQTALFMVDGRNSPMKWDGGSTVVDFGLVFSTQASSVTSNTIGLGAKTFTIDGTAKGWVVGDLLTIHSAGNAGNRMSGAITSYTHPTLVMNITSIAGSGTKTDWVMGQADFEDKPYLVTAHKDHLFLAYPRGQLQTSNLGDPMTFGATAALFGVGEEITGLTSLKGSVLGVFCDNKVSLLDGSSKLDWSLALHAQNIGTKLFTVQENAGNALMLCSRGVVSLQATQSFGSFEPAIFSRDIKPLLDAKLRMATCTRIVRGKYQYRIYFSDKSVLSACITTPNAVIEPKDVAFMPMEYEHQVVCVGGGNWQGEDAMFFGTADGWVMREDVGTSFDGAVIEAVIRLHFNHLKQPVTKKRYHKLTLELESAEAVDINFKQIFDYSDSVYATSINRRTVSDGIGGQWGLSEWGGFYWSLPITTQAEANIDGVSRNMAFLLWTSSDSDLPIVLQGLILQYSVLGLTR